MRTRLRIHNVWNIPTRSSPARPFKAGADRIILLPSLISSPKLFCRGGVGSAICVLGVMLQKLTLIPAALVGGQCNAFGVFRKGSLNCILGGTKHLTDADKI